MTYHSIDDLEVLYDMAESFFLGRATSMPIKYMYRNKPQDHSTIQEAKLTGILTKYMKDNSGDQASCINNNIQGLFFSITPANSSGDIPEYSFFGNYRIMVPPKYLLPNTNIYFADFYCLRGSMHYVTLVVTIPGSEADRFCKYRLLKLDIKNNKFLYIDSDLGYHTYGSSGLLLVEVFYTEDIDLNQLRKEEDFHEKMITDVRGRGRSTPGGVPKKRSCTVCNLPR